MKTVTKPKYAEHLMMKNFALLQKSMCFVSWIGVEVSFSFKLKIYRIAGSNTGQEWCLEGRRRYPLIPRDSSLHTAFSVIANAAIKDVLSMAPITDHLKEEPRQNLPISTSPVVTEDPFSIVNARKVEMKFSKSPKKRSIEKDLPTQPLHTNMRIQQLYHSHSVGSGRSPTKQRRIQSKRHVSMKGKVPGKIFLQINCHATDVLCSVPFIFINLMKLLSSQRSSRHTDGN